MCRVMKMINVYGGICEREIRSGDRHWEWTIRENKQIKHRMTERSPTLRTILSYPTRKALAGAIDGVAGAVVGTEADLSTGPPIPATWTDCKTQRTKITSQNNPDLHIITHMQRLDKSINIMTPNLDTLL